jgi:hypothetical protein
MSQLGVPVLQSPDSDWLFDEPFLAEHLVIKNPNDADEAATKAFNLLENQSLWNEVSDAVVEFYSNFTVKSEVDVLLEHLNLKQQEKTSND